LQNYGLICNEAVPDRGRLYWQAAVHKHLKQAVGLLQENQWIHTPPSTKRLTESPTWPEDYVVFADDTGGGKPIIALTHMDGTPVYATYDAGNPFQMADSLADFFLAISKLIEIVYGYFNIFEIGDDDGLDPNFIDRITNEIEPSLERKTSKDFLIIFMGEKMLKSCPHILQGCGGWPFFIIIFGIFIPDFGICKFFVTCSCEF
jgi:hypothetical protein